VTLVLLRERPRCRNRYRGEALLGSSIGHTSVDGRHKNKSARGNTGRNESLSDHLADPLLKLGSLRGHLDQGGQGAKPHNRGARFIHHTGLTLEGQQVMLTQRDKGDIAQGDHLASLRLCRRNVGCIAQHAHRFYSHPGIQLAKKLRNSIGCGDETLSGGVFSHRNKDVRHCLLDGLAIHGVALGLTGRRAFALPLSVPPVFSSWLFARPASWLSSGLG